MMIIVFGWLAKTVVAVSSAPGWEIGKSSPEAIRRERRCPSSAVAAIRSPVSQYMLAGRERRSEHEWAEAEWYTVRHTRWLHARDKQRVIRAEPVRCIRAIIVKHTARSGASRVCLNSVGSAPLPYDGPDPRQTGQLPGYQTLLIGQILTDETNPLFSWESWQYNAVIPPVSQWMREGGQLDAMRNIVC
ncbi:hypothetical protein BDZ89DRAFT_1049657 [Hymenopellis radicata]|nr:hypothetical protein BDZ89DRAFT_1049657 [Hymenopellis radicata]